MKAITKATGKNLSTKLEAKGTIWVLTGNLRGRSYPIYQERRFTIGRDASCDIVLSDIKSSRVHAELIFYNEELVLTDLKSQNGTLLNQRKILQSSIQGQDRIIIGQTVLKYQENKLKRAELDREVKFVEPTFFEKFRLPILASVLIMLVWLVFSPDSKKKKTVVNADELETRESLRSLSSEESLLGKIQKGVVLKNKKLNKRVKSHVKDGMRELREDNYFRALEEFEKALDINPKDSQALYYRRKTKENLDKTVREYRIYAKRDIASIKYESALVSYCAIIRLLADFPEDKRYVSAKKDIEELQKVLDYDDGEIPCFSK